MWQVCFKEYDGGGMLVGLKPVKASSVRSLWRRIDLYLSACQKGMVREVGFYRDGKNYPSIVSDGKHRQFHAPITAIMPLFGYMKRISE